MICTAGLCGIVAYHTDMLDVVITSNYTIDKLEMLQFTELPVENINTYDLFIVDCNKIVNISACAIFRHEIMDI